MNVVNDNGIDVPVFSFGPGPVLPAGTGVPMPRLPADFFQQFRPPRTDGEPPRQRTRSRSQPTHPSGMGDDDALPPKPQWVPPSPPGPTLRQRVEKRECELQLRCSDISCGLGPTDEDPEPTPGIDVTKVRQIGVHRVGKPNEDVCEHKFHSACLVSAERVAGWGGDEKEGNESGEVEVSCPVCRAIGCVTKEEWDEGVIALA